MLVIRSGGFGVPAQAKFAGKTGMLVTTAEVFGQLYAYKHTAPGTKPAGLFYIDIQTKSIANLQSGAPGQDPSAFVPGEYGVVYSQAGTAITDQLEPGIYGHGDQLTASANGLLKVAGEGDAVFADVMHGSVVGSTSPAEVEIRFNI